MTWLLGICFLLTVQGFAAVETRMGLNMHDSPRMLAGGNLRASHNNYDIEVNLLFDRVLVGMAFETFGMSGRVEDSDISEVHLNYKRTAAVLGYRFARGQYGPVDVTSDIAASYGFITDTSYQEKSANQTTQFTGGNTPATSIYYLGTYGYGRFIGGIKVGHQWAQVSGLASRDGQLRAPIKLSSPFIGLSLGLFL